MADTKILSATSAGALVSTDGLPLQRVGSTTPFYTTSADIKTYAAGAGISVKQYGAVGNGVADDTAAVQATATAIRAAGGGSLYLPAGKYKITSTVTINLTDPSSGLFQSFEMHGDGGLSQLYYTPTDGTDCLYILGLSGGLGTLHLYDFSMLGAGAAAATGNAIYLRRCIMPHIINNVYIDKFGGGAGIKAHSCWMGNYQSDWIYNCVYGIQMGDDPTPGAWGSSVNNTIQTCHLTGNSSHGFYGGCNHLNIHNCVIEGNGGAGIYLDHARHVDINNVYFESNAGVDAAMYDIYTVHSPYIRIQHCTGNTVRSVYTDADTSWLITENNEWDGTVVLDGYGVRNYVSSITGGTGAWRNLETTNATGTLAANDTSPSVVPTIYGIHTYYTANTNPTTITNFDDGYDEQEITVIINDAVTTLDFSGQSLKGNNGVDYAASLGDGIRASRHKVGGTPYWYCEIIK